MNLVRKGGSSFRPVYLPAGTMFSLCQAFSQLCINANRKWAQTACSYTDRPITLCVRLMQFEKHDKLSFTCKHSDGALMDRVYKAVALPSARRDLLSLYK